MPNIVKEKSFAFAVSIVIICDKLKQEARVTGDGQEDQHLPVVCHQPSTSGFRVLAGSTSCLGS